MLSRSSALSRKQLENSKSHVTTVGHQLCAGSDPPPQGTWSRRSAICRGCPASVGGQLQVARASGSERRLRHIGCQHSCPHRNVRMTTSGAGKSLKSERRRCSHEQRRLCIITSSFECQNKRPSDETVKRAMVFVTLLATSVSHRLGVHLTLSCRNVTFTRLCGLSRESVREHAGQRHRVPTAVRLNLLLAWTRQQDGANTSDGGFTDNIRFHEVFSHHII